MNSSEIFPADLLILSNGPGELTTWVRPVVQQVRQYLTAEQLRISVILSPCPHATGREAEIARRYPEVDRVQAPEHFWQFLLQGKTAQNWQWHPRGVILFLGGDQFFTVITRHRLGYRTVIYAEWDARWYRWIDRFGVINASVQAKVPAPYRHKLTVVGDLMAEVATTLPPTQTTTEVIGVLPGSKPAKLTQGVPLGLTIAEHIHRQRSQTRFIIPVAPTLDITTLTQFADPQHNPLIQKMGWTSATLKNTDPPTLITPTGLEIELITQTPAYNRLCECCLCLTTIGANTAELGALAIPMIVLIPTQQLDAMRAWDGLPGVLANLPGIGSLLASGINWVVLQQGKRFAWPNIWAKATIVPELVGKLEPATVAAFALDYLEHPEKLKTMREQLQSVRGVPGAAPKLTQIILEELRGEKRGGEGERGRGGERRT